MGIVSHSIQLRDFIRENSHLFWYTPDDKKDEVSEEFIMEQVLNYCDLPTIKKFFDIVGIEKAHQIFNKLTGRRKNNIYPEIYNLFDGYFKRHAQRNTQS